MKRCLFALTLAACTATPEQAAKAVEDRRTTVMDYAAALQLTPVAFVCVGYERGDAGIRRARCDLRTKEAGVLPLVCNSACRLLD